MTQCGLTLTFSSPLMLFKWAAGQLESCMTPQAAKPEGRARHYLSRFLHSSILSSSSAVLLSLPHIHSHTHSYSCNFRIMQLKICKKGEGEICVILIIRGPGTTGAESSLFCWRGLLALWFSWSILYLPFLACLFQQTGSSILTVNLLNIMKTSFSPSFYWFSSQVAFTRSFLHIWAIWLYWKYNTSADNTRILIVRCQCTTILPTTSGMYRLDLLRAETTYSQVQYYLF